MKIARKVLSVEACGNYFAVRTNAVTLRLYFLTLRIAPNAQPDGVRTLPFFLYEDDGSTLKYQHGDYCLTEVTVTGRETLNIDFKVSVERQSTVEEMLIEVASPMKGALFAALEGRQLPRFLTADDFDAAAEGWYYRLTDRVIAVKFRRPVQHNFTLTVSTAHFDLIGMENNGGKDGSAPA